MPKSNFRMLICGNSGSGKTNLLYHILMKPLVYYDQIHLYGKNLEQEKYRHMIETMNDISSQVGYDIMHCNNDDIKPVNSLESDAQKIVIFDDFICDKNQKPLIDYFIQGRHKNCSVIYFSQSFYKTPKDIRLNCSHYVIYDFPSSNERNMISRELNVTKDQYIKATKQPYSFLYLDNLKILNTYITKASDHTNRFAYLMDPTNGLLQWTDLLTNSIALNSIGDLNATSGNYHTYNKKVIFASIRKNSQGGYKWRLAIQCYPLQKDKEYTLCLEILTTDYQL